MNGVVVWRKDSPDVKAYGIRNSANVRLWNPESLAWNPESWLYWIQNPRISMESRTISVEPVSLEAGSTTWDPGSTIRIRNPWAGIWNPRAPGFLCIGRKDWQLVVRFSRAPHNFKFGHFTPLSNRPCWSRGYTSDFYLAPVMQFFSDFVASPARRGGYTCDKFWRQIEGRVNRILQETWAL